MHCRFIQAVVLLVCVAAQAGCSGPSPYTKITVKYADGIDASTGALRAGGDLAGQICLERAWLTYLQARLYLGAGSDIRWSKWLSTAKATPKLAWNDYCAEVRQSAKAVAHALGVLGQYAAALRLLAEQGAYDGAALGSLADSAGTLAGDTMTSQAAKGLATPMAKLSGLLLGKYTDGKLQRFAKEAHPHIEALLGGLEAFLSALERDLDSLERLSGPVFDTLEAATFPSEANIMGACRPAAFNHEACELDHVKVRSFLEWSTTFSSDMARRRDAVQALSAAVAALQKTQKRFVEAAPANRGIKEVRGGIAETLIQIAKARSALLLTEE